MKRRIAVFPSQILTSTRSRITDHYAAEDLSIAARFLSAVAETYEQLAGQQGIGRLYDSHEPSLGAVRYRPISAFSNYLLFYRIADGGVEILRILQGAREIRRALRQE